jgi:hypothetical protein
MINDKLEKDQQFTILGNAVHACPWEEKVPTIKWDIYFS